MAQGKRTDIETKATVIEQLINGKLWSDIARDTWVHESTVSRIKDNNLQEVARESKAIAELVDRNNRLQSLADSMIEDKIITGDEVIKISELVSLRQSTFTQNQLLTWKETWRIIVETVTIEI